MKRRRPRKHCQPVEGFPDAETLPWKDEKAKDLPVVQTSKEVRPKGSHGRLLQAGASENEEVVVNATIMQENARKPLIVDVINPNA